MGGFLLSPCFAGKVARQLRWKARRAGLAGFFDGLGPTRADRDLFFQGFHLVVASASPQRAPLSYRSGFVNIPASA